MLNDGSYSSLLREFNELLKTTDGFLKTYNYVALQNHFAGFNQNWHMKICFDFDQMKSLVNKKLSTVHIGGCAHFHGQIMRVLNKVSSVVC